MYILKFSMVILIDFNYHQDFFISIVLTFITYYPWINNKQQYFIQTKSKANKY